MRTLVESRGSGATEVSRQGGQGVAVDKKARLVMPEFCKFGVKMVDVCEMKWFGSALYGEDAAKYTCVSPSSPTSYSSPQDYPASTKPVTPHHLNPPDQPRVYQIGGWEETGGSMSVSALRVPGASIGGKWRSRHGSRGEGCQGSKSLLGT